MIDPFKVHPSCCHGCGQKSPNEGKCALCGARPEDAVRHAAVLDLRANRKRPEQPLFFRVLAQYCDVGGYTSWVDADGTRWAKALYPRTEVRP